MGLMSVMADIWRSRSRSALTMSAVAIGIFSVTVISAAGQIGTAKINDSLDDMGVNSVLVEAQEAGVALSDSDIDALGGLSVSTVRCRLWHRSPSVSLSKAMFRVWCGE